MRWQEHIFNMWQIQQKKFSRKPNLLLEAAHAKPNLFSEAAHEKPNLFLEVVHRKSNIFSEAADLLPWWPHIRRSGAHARILLRLWLYAGSLLPGLRHGLRVLRLLVLHHVGGQYLAVSGGDDLHLVLVARNVRRFVCGHERAGRSEFVTVFLLLCASIVAETHERFKALFLWMNSIITSLVSWNEGFFLARILKYNKCCVKNVHCYH